MKPKTYISNKITGAYVALCGIVWGLGLARTLAWTVNGAFFFRFAGVFTSMLIGAGFAWSLTQVLFTSQNYTWRKSLVLTPMLLPALDILTGSSHLWRSLILTSAGLALVPVLNHSKKRTLWGLVAISLPLVIYLPDLSPYVGRADTFEFQVVAPQLGIAHPSGYPLYILIGKIFSLLPLGSPAWRLNLSSAVFAALASGMLYLTLNKPATQRQPAPDHAANTNSGFQSVLALLVALVLAFSPTLWSRAIQAEVYTLNAFLVTLALWIANRWAQGIYTTAKALPLLGFVTGVAMASHLTLGALVFLAIPLMLKTPRPSVKTLVYSAGLGLTGLALYLYIPLRWPAVTGGTWMSAKQFLRFVTNAESGGALHALAFIQDPERWVLVLRLLKLQIGWAGLGLAIIGLIHLFWKRQLLAWGSLLALSAWIWFNLSFYVADPDYSAFLIPGHVIVIYWMGLGMSVLLKAASRKFPNAAYVIIPLLALLPARQLWTTKPALDDFTIGSADEAWGRYALQQDLAQGAAILADSEKFPPLYYLQQVEGLRPDLEMVTLFSEAQYREALQTRLHQGQRVYLARYLPGMDAYGIRSVGPLVEVAPPSIPTRNPDTALAHFGEVLALHAYELDIDPEGRPMHHLTLTWQAVKHPQRDLSIALRLRSKHTGAVVWEKAPSRPVNGYTSTQAWQKGHMVQDYHALNWPAWLPEQDYALDLGVFPRFETNGLTLNATHEVWFALQDVQIPHQNPPKHIPPLNSYFEDHKLWLKGASLASEAWIDAPLTVDLLWSHTGTPPVENKPMFHWVPLEIEDPSLTLFASYSITAPLTGQALRRYTLSTPAHAGRYRLEVGWLNGENISPARCGWLKPPRLFCPVGEIQVGAATSGLANFEDRILLLDAEMNPSDISAGGPLYVTFHWKCLQTLEKDYTVFVQMIGPDGKLYGQADSWPVQGARPTSNWAVGEEVQDPYQVYLKDGAPAGRYTVIVGWYLLADMSRLTVKGSEGHTVGDFYTVGDFTMPEAH